MDERITGGLCSSDSKLIVCDERWSIESVKCKVMYTETQYTRQRASRILKNSTLQNPCVFYDLLH